MKRYKKTKRMKELEKEFELPIHELLRILRVDYDMSMTEMAEYLGIQRRSVQSMLLRVGIYSKKLVVFDRYGKEVN